MYWRPIEMLVSVDIQWIAMIRPRDKSITVGMYHGAALPNVPQLISTEIWVQYKQGQVPSCYI